MPAAISTRGRPALPSPPYLVVGLGRAGTAAASALSSRDASVDVRAWDSASDPAQLERAQMLRRLGVDVRLGGDGIDILGGVRTVVKSPGVPPEIPVVVEAARRSLTIVDELEVGWRLVPSPTLAVTGTNGKSTVARLLVSVLDRHGMAPVLAANTEFGPPLSELSLGPTPRSVVAEVSSYQAEYSPKMGVDGAVFTNLTPEHLNRHGSMEAYAAAKRALFVNESGAVPVAAVNIDDEVGRRLGSEVEERGGRAIRYGRGGEADYRIVAARWGLREAEVAVETPAGPIDLSMRLPGAHNAMNVVSALAVADGLGLPTEMTLEALANADPVPGRFEVVDVDLPFDVVADFAYSADSVAAVLTAARAIVAPRRGRVIAVVAIVGRSGPLTGRAVGSTARELCDHLILSGTSYRGEPRMVTLAALAAGARTRSGANLEIVIDRRAAIARAMAAARPGDLVALLGRGATAREATDLRGGWTALDDRQAAREIAMAGQPAR